MSKILALSDPHFHPHKAHSKLVDGVNSRFLSQMAAWRQAMKIATDECCEIVTVSGDLFEIRGSMKPSVFNPVTRLMQDAIDRRIDLVVIPGNHDMEHFESGATAVDSWCLLEGYLESKCFVLSKPDVVEAGGFGLNDVVRVGGIPYMPDTEKFKETFGKMSDRGYAEVILIHQGVDDFNDGTYPTTGLTEEWLNANFRGWTLCGHYHNPCWNKGSRVVNVGSLLQSRASDEGRIRGVWVIDGGEIDFKPITAPEFVTVEKGFKNWKKVKGNYVIVKTKSVKEGEQLRCKAMDQGAASVVVRIEREFASAHEEPVKIASPREMLAQYLDIAPKHKARAVEIMKMFDRVCEGGEC